MEHQNEIDLSTIIKPELCEKYSEVKLTGIEDIKKKANSMIDKTGQKRTCGKEAIGQDAMRNLKHTLKFT